MNPLLIGQGGCEPYDIHMIVFPRPDDDPETVPMEIDFDFLMHNFTHVILKFRTTGDSTDWAQYQFVPPRQYLNKYRPPTHILIQKTVELSADNLLR